jgi:alkanesulfonate monooxygenase SsuD/methylene tetrahydromethanopterin reductase-like flavin-dependent oxidoreductase (luciferase family)
MRFGVSTTNFGPCGDPRTLIELAQIAESSGWQGFFLWDHLQWPGMEPAADPWVALSAIATATEKIHIGTLVTPLPRRDIVKLAREMITLDHLSDGRLILGVGLGWQTIPEYAGFGHEEDLRIRGEMLDEGLGVLHELISGRPVDHHGKHFKVVTEQPFAPPRHIPIWVAGQWPAKKPFRRAAHWDGVVPISKTAFEGGAVSPDDVRELIALMAEECEQRETFDVVTMGSGEVKAFEDAGVTWRVEAVVPFAKTLDEMKEQIGAGPQL